MSRQGSVQFAFPTPGRVLKIVLIAYFAVWLIFTLGMNWGGVSGYPLGLLMATQDDVASGQIWRLVTTAWVPDVGSVFSLLITLFLLLIFGAQLEKDWGGKRFASFLFWSGTLSYTAQFLMVPLLPAFLTERIMQPAPFGAGPVLEACVIAWALTNPNSIIYLFLVIPVRGKVFIYLTVGINILFLIALQVPQSGFLALFFGMGAGWLLGGSTPSPLRRMVLKYKLAQLEREAETERRKRKKRAERAGFQVVPGGKDEKPPRDRLN